MKPIILCVDDEAVIRDALKAELKAAFGHAFGYETAESGDEALELIAELNEDGEQLVVIVSDWLMPGMKGDELLINVHREFPDIITMMLTGQADPESVERARREAGLFECLHKPMDSSSLVAAVQGALDHLQRRGDEHGR